MNTDFEFQAFSWTVDDGTTQPDDYENMDFTVHIFGKTRAGESVAVHVSEFAPSFCGKFAPEYSDLAYYEKLSELLRLQLKIWDTSGDRPEEVADLADHLIDLPDSEKILDRKTLWGFENGKIRPFFQFAFKSQQAYDKLKGLLRACGKHRMTSDDMDMFYEEVKAIRVENKRDYTAKYELTHELVQSVAIEKQVPERVLRWIIKLGDAELPLEFGKAKLFEVIDPILRFAHLRDLRMAGWIRLANPRQVSKAQQVTTCTWEFRVTYEDVSSWESDDICPKIKELAFDVEAYSWNDQFPDPSIPENSAFQIAVTLKDYADSNIRRILLHLRSPVTYRGDSSGRCGAINGVEVINFETEKELLLYFARLIIEEDPDILYGYNSDIFDWNYLMVRAEVTGCIETFARLSRMKDHRCTVEAKSFQSAAYGDNKYLRIDIPGRLNVDLMIWVQRNMPPDRYPSYALDVVAETEIGQNKHDVDHKAIFAAYRTGDEEKCTEVGDYCCQDAVLVQKLVIKLDVVTQMFEMSNITTTPPMYLLQKGQEIKAFSQISKKAMQKGFLVPLADDRSEGSFTGAIVLEPDVGQYLSPVAVLDFASLYPSIQVAYQVCYTTIVLKQCPNCKLGVSPCQRSRRFECQDNLPGVEYSTIEWDDTVYVYREKATPSRPRVFKSIDEAKIIAKKKAIEENIARNDPDENVTWRKEKKHHRYRFAQRQPSVIPDLQVELKKNRKAVKRLMGPIEHSKDPEDQLRYRVLNGRQLAIKVSMNSIYGFTSAFKLNLVELSAAVTAMGRHMIEQTRTFMETQFEGLAVRNRWTVEDTRVYYDATGREVMADVAGEGWIRKFPTAIAGEPWTSKALKIHVVGGDSVTGDTPILCRTSQGILTYRTIDDLGSGPWETRVDGKEYQLCDMQVWSDTGFTPVRHIIRHATDKKMFRVRTTTGIVDVTEDHSLLRPNGQKVKPNELSVGEQLLHADLPNPSTQAVDFDDEYAWTLGLFFADGSCGRYGVGIKSKASWTINNQDEALLNRAKLALERHEPLSFNILDTMRSSSVYKLSAHSGRVYGGVVRIVEKWRAWFYHDKYKKVPDFILNATESIRFAFAKGYYAGDGYWSDQRGKALEMSCKGKIGCAGLYHLFASLDYTVTVSCRQDKMDIFRLRCFSRRCSDSHDLRQNEQSLPLQDATMILDGRKPKRVANIAPLAHLNEIRQLIPLKHILQQQLVYDIETESHHFHVGPGRLQAHNTDSVFCNFPASTLQEAISLCHKAEVILTEEIFNRAPIEMEYEKTYLPMIILKKKNYIGLKYEMDDQRWKIDFKGIAVKRRNYCPLAKEVFWNVIYPALGVEPDLAQKNKFVKASWDFREGPDRAVVALTNSLSKLERNDVPIDDLVITKSLKSSYKSENLPHIQLAKRMKERDAGSAPQPGQRFGLIVVNEASRGNELRAKTEDPRYAKANNIPPDYLFYLDNQMRKPLVNFLTLIGRGKEAEKVFTQVQTVLFNQLKAARRKLELETRAMFCGGGVKRAALSKIAPLKPPKKTTVTKQQKQERITSGTASLKQFFVKAEDPKPKQPIQ